MDGTALLHHLTERLSGNAFNDANLAKVNFLMCNLRSTEFIKSDLTNSFFKNTTLHNISISECSLTECKIKSVNSGSKPALLNIKESCFSKSKFESCDFTGCIFDGCRFDSAMLEGIRFDKLVRAQKRMKLMAIGFTALYISTVAVMLWLLLSK